MVLSLWALASSIRRRCWKGCRSYRLGSESNRSRSTRGRGPDHCGRSAVIRCVRGPGYALGSTRKTFTGINASTRSTHYSVLQLVLFVIKLLSFPFLVSGSYRQSRHMADVLVRIAISLRSHGRLLRRCVLCLRDRASGALG
jgi:hypothetical protein